MCSVYNLFACIYDIGHVKIFQQEVIILDLCHICTNIGELHTSKSVKNNLANFVCIAKTSINGQWGFAKI